MHGFFTRNCSLPYGMAHILDFFSFLPQQNCNASRVSHRGNFWLLVKPSLHLLSKPWLWQPAVQITFFGFSSKILQKLIHLWNNQCFSLHKNRKQKSSWSFKLTSPSIMPVCAFLSLSFVLVFSIKIRSLQHLASDTAVIFSDVLYS